MEGDNLKQSIQKVVKQLAQSKIEQFQRLLTSKSDVPAELEQIQAQLKTTSQAFRDLFESFRSSDRDSLAEIEGIRFKEKQTVISTYVDLMIRTSGLPEVFLMTVLNSILPSTFSFKFFSFIQQIIGHEAGRISKDDLVNIVETLGSPERLGKAKLLKAIQFYDVKSLEMMSFLHEGDASRRVLNPQTRAELFNKFKATSEDKEVKVDYCDFVSLLPLLLALFVEDEINAVITNRTIVLSIIGLEDSMLEFGPKTFKLNDVLPFTTPVPKAAEDDQEPDRPELMVGYLPGEEIEEVLGNLIAPEEEIKHEMSMRNRDKQFAAAIKTRTNEAPQKGPSLIKVALKVMSETNDINTKALSFRDIQTILDEFRVLGFTVRTT
jgi:hypothetical protein